jgi:hypothetical protein
LLQQLSKAKGNRYEIEEIEDYFLNKANVFNSIYKPVPINKNAWI